MRPDKGAAGMPACNKNVTRDRGIEAHRAGEEGVPGGHANRATGWAKTDHESTPSGSLPSLAITPSPTAAWKALGLEPMSNTYRPSSLYLRASKLRDPAEGESPVGQVLFTEEADYSTDVTDRQGRSARQQKKGKHHR